MMRRLIAWALQRRLWVLSLAVLWLGYGLYALQHLPLDVFPEFAPPLVEIQTEAPGLATEAVETLVSAPLELALSGLPHLQTLRSKSVPGLSSVVCLFQNGTDLNQARQAVQERLAQATAHLPQLARPPVVLPALSSTSRILKIGLTSPTLSTLELSDLALWTLRPRLLAVPGVANVAIWGQRSRQWQVRVDPDRLAAQSVSLTALLQASAAATQVAAGGFIDLPNQRLSVRQSAALQQPEDLAAALLKHTDQGSVLRIGDVADVGVGAPPPIGDAVVNDGDGLLLIVEKQPWGNTLAVTHQIEAVLANLRPALPAVEVDAQIFRPATFIERALHNLSVSLAWGCGLVALVLWALLRERRAVWISLTAIPLSLLSAVALLHLQGATLNTLVLAGLVIALGEVVDDAIIDVENITRRLHENQRADSPRAPLRVVLHAALEVRSAVVFASLIIALVFLPVWCLDGVAGAFFRPLAQAYLIAILASLLVALTVTPALCLLCLPGAPSAPTDTALAAALKRAYRRGLPFVLQRPRAVLAALLVALLLTADLVQRLDEGFLPDFKESDFLMHWVEKPGTSLDAMRRITVQASRALRAVPGVTHFGAHLGRAEVADEVVGVNFTELWISLDNTVDYDAALAKINAIVAAYPGLYRDVLTYLRERIKEVLSGTSATVVVRLYGPDLNVLRDQAAAVSQAITDVPGVSQLKVEAQAQVPQLNVRWRSAALSQFGLTLAQAQQALSTLLQGRKVGEIYQPPQIIDVVVQGSEALRHDVSALQQARLDTPLGSVALGDLADFDIEPAPNEIKREQASRRLDVSCNVVGADLGTTARAIETRVRALPFAVGYHPEFLGEYAARQTARQRLFSAAGAALVGIALLLYLDFQALRWVALMGVSLPFALIGGVLGAWAGGGVLSLGSLVGFITVLGIAARNGILLLSHYRHLEQHTRLSAFETALHGAEARLLPILMTAACAALALLPLLIQGPLPGHEIEYPMAWVILGGLLTSTALNLWVLPVLYVRFAARVR